MLQGNRVLLVCHYGRSNEPAIEGDSPVPTQTDSVHGLPTSAGVGGGNFPSGDPGQAQCLRIILHVVRDLGVKKRRTSGFSARISLVASRDRSFCCGHHGL